jgi:hypothetical protein
MATTAQATKWRLKGAGYEFCNCQPGCTCNFSGFPTSPDGSCKAFVGNHIEEGFCGDVDLAGVKAAAIIDWPGAIHEMNGKAVFVADPAVSDEQVDCLAQIFTGQLGGDPWAILGPTFSVAGLVRAPIEFGGTGVKGNSIKIPGVGEAKGGALKNPVTGEEHQVNIDLPTGFIWTLGECGVGSFSVKAEGVELAFNDSNWIFYRFEWSNH